MSKPSSQITAEARKVLRRWARDDFYVYLRPVPSTLIDPKAKFHLVWKISVEFRGVGWKQYVGEGNNLSETIIRMGLEVPRRGKLKKEPLGSGKVVDFTKNEQQVFEGMKKAERPRKRPKDKKAKRG